MFSANKLLQLNCSPSAGCWVSPSSVSTTEKTERLSAWCCFHMWFATTGWLLLGFLAKNCSSRMVNSHIHTQVMLNILLGYPRARTCVRAEQEAEGYFQSCLPASLHSCRGINLAGEKRRCLDLEALDIKLAGCWPKRGVANHLIPRGERGSRQRKLARFARRPLVVSTERKYLWNVKKQVWAKPALFSKSGTIQGL